MVSVEKEKANNNMENGIDKIKEQFMKLSLNELVLLAAEIKKTFEEKGLGYI